MKAYAKFCRKFSKLVIVSIFVRSLLHFYLLIVLIRPSTRLPNNVHKGVSTLHFLSDLTATANTPVEENKDTIVNEISVAYKMSSRSLSVYINMHDCFARVIVYTDTEQTRIL